MHDTRDDRAPLGRDRILEAAIRLADTEGVEALSMRKVAKELGYEVMSLYNHVRNKDDVLDGIVDLVAAEIDTPPPMPTGAAAPDRSRCPPTRRSPGTRGPRRCGRVAGRAAIGGSTWKGCSTCSLRAGLPDDLADLGFHAITNHVQGFTQQQINYSRAAADEAEMYRRFDREVTVAQYPRIVEHVRFHRETETTT